MLSRCDLVVQIDPLECNRGSESLLHFALGFALPKKEFCSIVAALRVEIREEW